MTPIEQEIARQRARLLAIERKQTAEITRAYGVVAARLIRDLRGLSEQIEQARERGAEVRPGWLFAQDRFRRLLADLREHTALFLERSARTVTATQRAAVQEAFDDGKRLARLALGPAPKDTVLRVTGAWDRMPTAALDTFIGRASDGTPLGDLMAEVAPLAPERVRDALAYGVATGRSPREMTREVQAASLVSRNRALVIARTEVISAHREAVTDTWQKTGIVQQWRWSCAKDTRTCAACWAQDGTTHPIDEPMGSHPCCRCARIPDTPSWAELGFAGIPDGRPRLPAGADVFAALPDEDKLVIIGRAKLEAYNRGEITLDDLVQHTHSDRWGRGIRVASLAEALA